MVLKIVAIKSDVSSGGGDIRVMMVDVNGYFCGDVRELTSPSGRSVGSSCVLCLSICIVWFSGCDHELLKVLLRH